MQKDDTRLSDVRFPFNYATSEFPQLDRYCSKNARIIHSESYEDAIVKIQNGEESTLTNSECESVEMLTKNCNVQVTTIDNYPEEGDFAANLLKRRKRDQRVGKSAYQPLDFLLPTSNLIERFFSSATFTYFALRQKLLPMNAEMQVFLKVNKAFWNEEVTKALNES